MATLLENHAEQTLEPADHKCKQTADTKCKQTAKTIKKIQFLPFVYNLCQLFAYTYGQQTKALPA